MKGCDNLNRQAVTDPARSQRPRRRRHFFRKLLVFLLLIVLTFALVRFGPNLYRRFFGDGNTTWISQRFSEEVTRQNRFVVYKATLTGQETVTQSAWLLGTVQSVTLPYTYELSVAVDMEAASVSVDTAADTIQVRLPSPVAAYPSLTVDQDHVQKNDWLFPLTPERYAEIVDTIEKKLYAECATKPEYLAAAWNATVDNIQGLFRNVASASKDGVTCTVQVIQDDHLVSATSDATTDAPTATALPSAT